MPFESKKQGFESLSSSELRNFISNAPEGRVQEAGKRELARREKSKSSVALSETMRRDRIEGPRGRQIPGELETLRRSMSEITDPLPQITAVNNPSQDIRYNFPPQQLTIPRTTGYEARQRQSPADIAAQQLESYMKSRMIGRSTPLTSEVVIQPRLF